MGEYEDLQDKRNQRRKLLDSMTAEPRDETDNASIPGQDLGDGNFAEGRNDGSESGGVAPVGGVIDLESARQQYKGLTGEMASAKWSADQIAERIAAWRLEHKPLENVGQTAQGEQRGPLTDEDEKIAEQRGKAEGEQQKAQLEGKGDEVAEKAQQADAKVNAKTGK